MVANQLSTALSTLQCVITRSRAVDVLGRLRPFSTATRPDVQAVLQVFAAFCAEQAQFGKTERAVLEATQLNAVVEPAWWARLVTALSRSTMPEDLAADLIDLCARLEIVASGLPALATLLEASTQAVARAGAGALAIAVAGQAGQPASLSQIACAIEAMNQLWAVAELLTGQGGTLHLVATEPGPAATLRFDGQAEPLEELHGLLLSVREQQARLPDATAEQYAALVPPMLPVLDRIGRSGRSDALRVRIALESGVRYFLQAGCTLHGEDAPPPDEAPGTVGPPSRTIDAPLVVPLTATGYDAGRLAKVIAEERRQLHGADGSPRQIWQAGAAGR